MKSPILKFFTTTLGISFLIGMQSFSVAAAKTHTKYSSKSSTSQSSCQKEKAEFKNLYIELQKSLNYEGKDAYLDAKNHVALKAHTGDTYEGKVFEEALFKEYQNTLRKVGLMYQAAKFDSAAPKEFSSNPALVDFIKAIDSNDGAKYISANNVNTVIDGLQQASVAKYPADSKFRINDNDKYLLKKLLTHAQDRLCSIEKYQETGKRDRNFTAEELEKKKNAPLNQLILALKDAKITQDSDIKLNDIVDEKAAINSAIAANINAISEWMKKNKTCLPEIKSLGFMHNIQAGIQQCNYRKFVDALSDNNVTNIESILHFINSNEKFLKGTQTKAETAMDELKLQAYVDRAFANLSNKINCTEVTNSTKLAKRLFVRNLPYNDQTNKFDTSKLLCKVKVPASKKGPASERILSEQECTNKIDLISDELGRGLEVKQKNPKEAPISFSVKDNPDCNDIALVIPHEEVKPELPSALTNEICIKRGEEMKPPQFLILGILDNKPACVPKYDDAKCKIEGEKEKPPVKKIAKQDFSGCDIVPADTETEETCIAKGKAEVPPTIKTLINGKCELKPKKTKEECEKEGKDLSEDEYSCIEKKKVFTKEECEKDGKDLAPDALSCIEKTNDEDKKCEKNNAELYAADEIRPVLLQWRVINGKCVDTKADKSSSKKRDTEKDEPEEKVRPEQPFTAPARFVPVQIPTRQMYILPGMP